MDSIAMYSIGDMYSISWFPEDWLRIHINSKEMFEFDHVLLHFSAIHIDTLRREQRVSPGRFPEGKCKGPRDARTIGQYVFAAGRIRFHVKEYIKVWVG